jgi:glucokinase
MIYLTVGTGIGGALILDGKIHQGSQGLASEMGHMMVDLNGPICSCGKRGHLEAIASGPAISQIARERMDSGEASILEIAFHNDSDLNAEKISQAAHQGDKLALDVINNAGSAIGVHLASLIHALNPARIVIGGGMAQIGELLFNPIREAIVGEIILPAFLKNVEIIPAQLGDNAGLIGAMILAREA